MALHPNPTVERDSPEAGCPSILHYPLFLRNSQRSAFCDILNCEAVSFMYMAWKAKCSVLKERFLLSSQFAGRSIPFEEK